jgi:hypothetical protein
MLARSALRSFGIAAAPNRQAYQLAKRTVTTDAASSHAEKDDVPDVCCANKSHRWDEDADNMRLTGG